MMQVQRFNGYTGARRIFACRVRGKFASNGPYATMPYLCVRSRMRLVCGIFAGWQARNRCQSKGIPISIDYTKYKLISVTGRRTCSGLKPSGAGQGR